MDEELLTLINDLLADNISNTKKKEVLKKIIEVASQLNIKLNEYTEMLENLEKEAEIR